MSRRKPIRGLRPIGYWLDEIDECTIEDLPADTVMYPDSPAYRSQYPILLSRGQIERFREAARKDPVYGEIMIAFLADAVELPEYHVQAPSPVEYRREYLGHWHAPSEPLIPQGCR